MDIIKNLTFLLLIICNCIFPCYAAIDSENCSNDKNKRCFWESFYHKLDEKKDTRVKNVKKVFNSVNDGADKDINRIPSLLILDNDYNIDSWAFCIKDGTIIITQEAIDICYNGVSTEQGDDRMAFLLGHELAHIFKNDFTYNSSFIAAKKEDTSDNKELSSDELIDSLTSWKNIEVRADKLGLVYASISGFNPKTIIDSDNNFFKEWTERIENFEACHDELHPEPALRIKKLRNNIAEVCEDLNLYHYGVRLLQIQDYANAKKLLEEFSEIYPSREVFNNIGIAYYHLAIESLVSCNDETAYEYKMSIIIDTNLTAENLLVFKGQSKNKDCKNLEIFKKQIEKAISMFQKACNKDKLYLPSVINLTSALILQGYYNDAINKLNEYKDSQEGKFNPEKVPQFLNNFAIATYLNKGTSYLDDSHDNLDFAIKEDINYSSAYYNKARFYYLSGDTTNANIQWKKFLNIEKCGQYANNVYKHLKLKNKCNKLINYTFYENPVVEPNDIIKPSNNTLSEKGYTRKVLSNGIEYFTNQDTIKNYKKSSRIFLINNSVKLVDSPIKNPISYEKLIAKYPYFRKIHYCNSNIKTIVYNNFAVDVENGITTRAFFFPERIIIAQN